ncbi:MAG: NADH-quinone oxidoreductase subunit H, partial [Rhodospirillaceae bacterium]|nr:NADH-quinone oxidoreductase subunit H [Rhodospirillaceae bacterium]
MIISFFFSIFHALLIIVAAPLITGIICLTKSRLQGRLGASVLQPYRDLWRLLQKESVVAESASLIFFIT